MGGLVAFEMAHQLIGQKETVDLLALFDTVPPSQAIGGSNGNGRFSMLERFALDIGQMVLGSVDELHGQFLQLLPHDQFKLVLDLLVRENVLPQGSGESELNRLLEIFTRNSMAMDSYRLRPLKQRITLFPATGREVPERLAEEWKPWTTSGVDLQAVPGDHYTMLKPPHAATVAAILASYLDPQLQRRNGPDLISGLGLDN